jgi:hypothetical protein
MTDKLNVLCVVTQIFVYLPFSACFVALGIVYNATNQLQLALRFPDMITDHIEFVDNVIQIFVHVHKIFSYVGYDVLSAKVPKTGVFIVYLLLQ